MKININDYKIIDKPKEEVKANNTDNFIKSTSQNEEDNLLKGESAAVIAGAKIIQKNGYKVDKETINKLKDYFSGDKSEIPEKLEALKIAVEKDIPLKESLLSKIQFNTNISMLDFLDDVELIEFGAKKDEYDYDYERKNIYKSLEKNEKLMKNIFEIIDEKDDEFIKKIQGIKFSDDEKSSHMKIFDEFDDFIDTFESGVKSFIENNGDYYDNENGFEIENQAYKDIEMLANYLNASQNTNSFSLDIQAVLEVKITQKMIDLKNDFIDLKREISLDIIKISEENSNLSKEDKVNILFESIDKLDNAIMKSEMSLYIDLKGERELIKISSKLEIARKKLENGNVKEAENILKMAKKTLDNLKYEPSIKKAFVMFNEKNIKENYGMKDIHSWIKDSVDRFTNNEKSVSNLINYLRKMGINNDVEEFQNLQNSRQNAKDSEFKNLMNLKEMLIKMNENASEKAKDNRALKMIEHIEGSQIKNKILDSKMQQSIELDIPIKLSGRIKNVKVFIKSPQKMLKLDWENFDMYFVLSSEKLGEMGIRVNSVQRNLSVKIINDKAQKLGETNNLNDDFKAELEEFGYRLSRMVLEAWNKTIKSDDEQNIEKKELNSNENSKIDIMV